MKTAGKVGQLQGEHQVGSTPQISRLEPRDSVTAGSGPGFSPRRAAASCCLVVQAVDTLQKQDAAHEPECSHVCSWYRCRNTWKCSHAEHFSETVYLNSLVHFSPVTIPVHRRLEYGRRWRAKCRVWNVESGV